MRSWSCSFSMVILPLFELSVLQLQHLEFPKQGAHVHAQFASGSGAVAFVPAQRVAAQAEPGTAGEGGLTEEAAIEQVVVRTEAAIEEMSESFNLQYLMLQNKIVHENRQLSMPSNIMKTDHDTAKNSINNIR